LKVEGKGMKAGKQGGIKTGRAKPG